MFSFCFCIVFIVVFLDSDVFKSYSSIFTSLIIIVYVYIIAFTLLSNTFVYVSLSLSLIASSLSIVCMTISSLSSFLIVLIFFALKLTFSINSLTLFAIYCTFWFFNFCFVLLSFRRTIISIFLLMKNFEANAATLAVIVAISAIWLRIIVVFSSIFS